MTKETTFKECNDSRACFAKMFLDGESRCTVLESTYKVDGACPFCKPEREVTDGRVYPYNRKGN